MARKLKSPTFAGKERLARYVSYVNRQAGNRPAVATFLPDPPSETPDKDHLSVNSLEIETLRDVGNFHRAIWQDNRGEVAICEHQVLEYNDAAKKAGIAVNYDRESSKWKFASSLTSVEDAYRHRPVHRDEPPGSPSHCGVEFVRALKEHKAAQFARRLTGQRFHLLFRDR